MVHCPSQPRPPGLGWLWGHVKTCLEPRAKGTVAWHGVVGVVGLLSRTCVARVVGRCIPEGNLPRATSIRTDTERVLEAARRHLLLSMATHYEMALALHWARCPGRRHPAVSSPAGLAPLGKRASRHIDASQGTATRYVRQRGVSKKSLPQGMSCSLPPCPLDKDVLAGLIDEG